MPNIPGIALQHYCTLVAICGFLRRNLHERIAAGHDDPLKVVHLAPPGVPGRLKKKSSLNENRRPLATPVLEAPARSAADSRDNTNEPRESPARSAPPIRDWNRARAAQSQGPLLLGPINQLGTP
jgi:hypothetical protein